jgi:hypothetical protein
MAFELREQSCAKNINRVQMEQSENNTTFPAAPC